MISVVIPTLEEAETIASAVSRARGALGECEVVVVDGGSTDGTLDAARAAGALVIEYPGRRSEAMNRGAAVARGKGLLFLHADTMLPAGAGVAIDQALQRADGGAFHLRFDDSRRFLVALSEIRSRWLRAVYGDQAIFASREAFMTLGGYRPLPIMEDYDLVLRLRRQGSFVLLPLAVTTSARRHRRHGTIRTLVRVWWIQVLYRAGVSPARLAKAYPPAR